MGETRINALKIRNQCYGCRERQGTQCVLGLPVMCRRQNTKSCEHYRQISVDDKINLGERRRSYGRNPKK